MTATLLVCLFSANVSADDETTVTFFNETFGTPSDNTAVESYTGWSETGVSYSGTAKVGKTSTYICDIDGSSKGGYLYFNSSSNTIFYIDSLNTKSYENVYLTFNLKKSNTNNTFTVSYTTDSLNGSYTKLSLSSSVTTTSWKTVTFSKTLPSSSYLCLKIEHTTNNIDRYIYIDDLQLYGTATEGTETEEDNETTDTSEDDTIEMDTTETVTLSFGQSSYSLTVGDTATLTASSNSAAEITYSSSDSTIAAVNPTTGFVTAADTGTVIITATIFDADSNAVTATCSLTVTEASSYKKGEYALVGYLSSYKNYYAMCNTDKYDEGDRLDATCVHVVNSKVIYTDTINSAIKWTVDEEAGTILSSDGKYAAYLNETNYPVYIGLSSKTYSWHCTQEDDYFYTSSAQERVLAANKITAGYVFGAYAVSSILTQSIAVAMPFAYGFYRKVTSGYYGTICQNYAIAADDIKGAEFYSPLGKVIENGTVTSIVLEQVDELEAGIPYVFLATGDSIVGAYSGEKVTTAGTNNGLIGTFSDINNIAEGMYMISDNELKKVGSKSGGLYANRAYFNLDTMSVYSESQTTGANIRILTLADDDETGVTPIEAEESTMLTDVYNLCGLKIRSQVPISQAADGLRKGIYIINGKKRIVK